MSLARASLFILLLAVSVVPGNGAFARMQDGDTLPRSRAGNVRAAEPYERAWTDVLRRVVDDSGLVDYEALRGPVRDDFRQVLKAIETFDASALGTRREKLAFWMNAYNIQMLQHILQSEGITNVIADGRNERFFRMPYLTAGMALSLDEIENVILRGPAESGPLAPLALESTDPRLHAGVNCAAMSCPRLRRRAFTPSDVDEQLDEAMREFVSSPRYFRMEDGELVASSIIDWYAEDFDAPGRPAGDWLISYMDPDRPNADAISSLLAGRTVSDLRQADDVRFAYDWTVNDRALHR